jgi:hypothetical protein
MKNLFICYILFFVSNTYAQISVTPNPLNFAVDPLLGDQKFQILITNSKDTTYTLYWQIEKDSTWPMNWYTAFNDINIRKVSLYNL